MRRRLFRGNTPSKERDVRAEDPAVAPLPQLRQHDQVATLISPVGKREVADRQTIDEKREFVPSKCLRTSTTASRLTQATMSTCSECRTHVGYGKTCENTL